jgi:hypothetical protein
MFFGLNWPFVGRKEGKSRKKACKTNFGDRRTPGPKPEPGNLKPETGNLNPKPETVSRELRTEN